MGLPTFLFESEYARNKNKALKIGVIKFWFRVAELPLITDSIFPIQFFSLLDCIDELAPDIFGNDRYPKHPLG